MIVDPALEHGRVTNFLNLKDFFPTHSINCNLEDQTKFIGFQEWTETQRKPNHPIYESGGSSVDNVDPNGN